MQQINLLLNNTTNQNQNVSLFDIQGVDDAGNAIISNDNTFFYDMTTELALSNANGFTFLYLIFQPNQFQSYTAFAAIIGGAVYSTITDVLTGLAKQNLLQFSLVSGNIIQSTTQYLISTISLTEQTKGLQIPDAGCKFGSFIYQSTYINNGGVQQINPSNTWWINPTANTTSAPSNRVSVGWNPAFPPAFVSSLYQQCWHSFNASQSGKIVYIGINCKDCACAVYVNNQEQFYIPGSFVDNPQILNNLSYYGYNLNPATTSTNDLFLIVPLTLNIGYNLIQVLFGDGFISKQVAYQIYDNTAEQIANATSDAQLNILASSKSYIDAGNFFF